MATTLSRMIKKAAASSVILQANRTTCPHRNYTSSIFTAPSKTSATISTSNTTNLSGATSIQTHHHFSGLADEKSNTDDLLRSHIESELDGAEKKFHKLAETPSEFPFKIVDIYPWRMITLTREYHGEEIEVMVFPERNHQQSVPLIGRVSNKSGLNLEFQANAADGIKIKSLNVKNTKRDVGCCDETRFSDLGENAQKAFLKYFEVRGVEPNFIKNFNECLLKTKHEAYTAMLKKLKNSLAISTTNSTNLFGKTSIPTHLGLSITNSNNTNLSGAEKRSNDYDTLLGAMKFEVDCAEEKLRKLTEAAARELPFKILDTSGITLTREYQGEEIEVRVYGPQSSDEEGKEDKSDSRYIHLKVSVSKKSGRTLKFEVEPNVADGIITRINGLEVKNRSASKDDGDNSACIIWRTYYKKPDLLDLDENVQKTFQTYLEIRGLKHSTVKFSCDYMVQRKHVERTTILLKKLKTFIAN